MKTCPKCGADMRIKVKEGRRFYECKNSTRFRSPCFETLDIGLDEKLSIAEIASDMATAGIFTDSATRRKEQTQLRKLGTGLMKLSKENPYLSTMDRAAMVQIHDTLERLATAAEKSKNELKRREEAEKKRIEDRHRQLHRAFTNKYKPVTQEEKLALALALAKVYTGGFRSDPADSIRRTMARINERGPAFRSTPKEMVDSAINTAQQEYMSDMIRSFANDTKPVETLIDDTTQAIDAAMSNNKGQVNKLMEQITTFLVRHQIKEGNKHAKQHVE